MYKCHRPLKICNYATDINAITINKTKNGEKKTYKLLNNLVIGNGKYINHKIILLGLQYCISLI